MQDETKIQVCNAHANRRRSAFFASSLSVAKNQLLKELINGVQSENFGY